MQAQQFPWCRTRSDGANGAPLAAAWMGLSKLGHGWLPKLSGFGATLDVGFFQRGCDRCLVGFAGLDHRYQRAVLGHGGALHTGFGYREIGCVLTAFAVEDADVQLDSAELFLGDGGREL